MLIGIKARCLLAMSRVVEPFDKNKSDDLLFDAFQEAQSDGVQFGLRTELVPAMFVGEEHLLSGWFSGSAFAFESDEIEQCYGCRTANGNPCPRHG